MAVQVVLSSCRAVGDSISRPGGVATVERQKEIQSDPPQETR